MGKIAENEVKCYSIIEFGRGFMRKITNSAKACNHLYVYSQHSVDGSFKCGCVKCDYEVQSSNSSDINVKILPYICDMNLARAIYTRCLGASGRNEEDAARRFRSALRGIVNHPDKGSRNTMVERLDIKGVNNQIVRRVVDKLVVRTIDLWTELEPNSISCFEGAFIDGFVDGERPYDSYKVIYNGNCIIKVDNKKYKVRNKHQAIVFYKGGVPVRLLVANKETNMDRCIGKALEQKVSNEYRIMKEWGPIDLSWFQFKRTNVDLHQEPVENGVLINEEIGVLSCDRPKLLTAMLSGSYTEDEPCCTAAVQVNYAYNGIVSISYYLETDTEVFSIKHGYSFYSMGSMISVQVDSVLGKDFTNGNYGDALSLVMR